MANAMHQSAGADKETLRDIKDNSNPKILLVGDVHLSDKPPSSCTDGYLEDLLDMILYIGKLGRALKVDATVFAGDIFHHKQPSRTSHSTVLRAIKAFSMVENAYAVQGNHDQQGDRTESVREKQPLGVLYESGALTELDGWHDTLPLFGVPWQQRWMHEETPADAFAEWQDADQMISRDYTKNALAVTHAPIYPKGEELEFEFVPTAGAHGLSEAMGNEGSLYYGHIHEPHGIFDVEGVTYANFGALSRGSLHEYNVKRKIQVGIWQQYRGFQAIDIPHRPANEVFRIAEANEKKAEKLSLDSFLSEVGSATLDISSTETVIQHIKDMSIEPPVKTTSIEILEEVS